MNESQIEILNAMDSHWKEVVDLADKYGFIDYSYDDIAFLAKHKSQIRMHGENTYIQKHTKLYDITP